MSTEVPFYLLCFREELRRRRQRNRRYSLRAFAAHLGLDAGALSRMLNGKQPLTLRSARLIVDQLDLAPKERERFLLSTIERRSRSEIEKILGPEQGDLLPRVTEIDIDVFHTISDLHHSAILELTRTEDFRSDIASIAARLGLTRLQTRLAVERLVRLGLLRKNQGRYEKTVSSLAVRNKDVSTPALRRQQREILSRAVDSLSTVPIEKRIANSITMPIDPEKIPLARRLITDFCRSLCESLETGRRCKVYQLHVNLFPLEKEASV